MRDRVVTVLCIALQLLLLSACATPKPIASLNLMYNPAANAARGNSIKIALVKPHYTGTSQVNTPQPAVGGLFGSMLAAHMSKYAGPDQTIAATYNKDYSLRIQNSMLTDVEKILRAKGFKINQSYDSFDEIPYADKQKIELIVVPTFDFGPQVTNKQKITNLPLVGPSVSNEGTVQLIGKLKVEFIEPMSKEKIMIKTVDVTSLGSTVPTEYKDKEEAEYLFTELLNSNYPLVMVKVEKIMDTDELQLALKDIKRLKEKNK